MLKPRPATTAYLVCPRNSAAGMRPAAQAACSRRGQLTDARVLDLLCPANRADGDGDVPVASFRARDFVLATDTDYCLVVDSRESSTAPTITALCFLDDRGHQGGDDGREPTS